MGDGGHDKMTLNNGLPFDVTAAPETPLVARTGVEWAAMPERRAGPRSSAGPGFQEEVKLILLGRYTPACVLVDDSLNVLYVHGNVSAYLGPSAGAHAANLLKMLDGDLLVAIRAGILRAKSENRPVIKGVRGTSDGRHAGLTVEAIPVRSRSDRRRNYLILFKPAVSSAAAAQLEFDDSRRGGGGTRGAKKPRRGIDDELAAAKEELLAANAELVAVNSELRKGNLNLAAINDDLSNLLASSEIPILMLDRRMRLRRFTPPAVAAFGLTATSAGQSIANLRLNIEVPLLKEAVRAVLSGYEAKQLEVRDRQERWYSLWIRPYRTTSNVIDGAVLSMTDITEKRKGIRALEAARDYAEAIVDTVNDSLVILDRHLKVRSASRFYYELFRESPAQIEGRSIYEIGQGRWNVPSLRRELSALAARETPFSGWEAEFDVPKLGRRTLTISGRVVPHDTDSERKIVLAIEDVSPRKQAAEAAALRKSEARQREFVANVTHELMTPIAAIKGYSESLVAGALEVPRRRVEFTQIIEKNADRLSELVEDILLLSSHDDGRVQPAPESLPLRATVDRLARSLAPEARKRGVSIRVRIPQKLRVAMNRVELTRVLQNLSENALKYNRKDGRVSIRARSIGKKILVSIQDTGIGIPKEDVLRVFDRFHRAGNARLKTSRGNGLGLSIVRSILANRGCRIRAESVEGKGSIFSFTLPRAEKSGR